MIHRWCYDTQGNEPFHGHKSVPLSQSLSCSEAEKVSGKIVWNITVSTGAALASPQHSPPQSQGIPAGTSVSLTQKSKKADDGKAKVISYKLPSAHDGKANATFLWEMSFSQIIEGFPDDWRETCFELE